MHCKALFNILNTVLAYLKSEITTDIIHKRVYNLTRFFYGLFRLEFSNNKANTGAFPINISKFEVNHSIMFSKKYLVIAGAFLALQGCSYKTTYQTIQYSTLDKDNPTVVKDRKGYIAHFDRGDQVLLGDLAVDFHSKMPVRLPDTQRKVYTVVRQGDTLQVANRLVDFKKVINFRDIGGLKTKDGKIIKWGKIYRSGHLNKLKKSEFIKFENLGLSTVIDLRTDKEIGKKPDHIPSRMKYFNYQAYDDSEDMFSKTRKDVIKGRVSPEVSNELVKEFYGLYATHDVEKVRTILNTILDNDKSTLFHCSAGKDRTGMVGAILLSILNVDREVIINEYLLSNNYRENDVAKRMKLAKFGKLFFHNINYEVIENFSWIKPEFIQAMFDEIDKQYGSMDNYIEKGLKISKEQREAYIDKFTY